MLTVFVFDERESRHVEDLRPALDQLGEEALLWLALRDPTEEEVATVQEVLELSDEQAHRLLQQPPRACVEDVGEQLHVTLYAASGEGDDPVLCPLECVLGPNWVVTAHQKEIETLEEFARTRRRKRSGRRTRTHRRSVAAVVDWVVTSYFRAFEEVETELEELDAKVMSDIPKTIHDELARRVELRRSIGTLKRTLLPHRELIAALAHSELDLLSTETSAERFAALESRVAQALEAAREAKESTRGSFDLLDARIGQRTSDVVKWPDAGHGDSPARECARRDHGDELQARPLRPGLGLLAGDRRDGRHRRARALGRPYSKLDLTVRRGRPQHPS